MVVDVGADPFIELFSESTARALVVVDPADEEQLVELAATHEVPLRRLGHVGGRSLEVTGQLSIGLDELREAWTATLPALFGPTVG